MAIARASPRAVPCAWISPNATFSHTGRLSKSALFWNSMPILRMAPSRAARFPESSSPSIVTLPPSGRRRPSRHLSMTDLPTPEQPITTTDSPLAMSRSRPSRTTVPPNALRTPRRAILGSFAPPPVRAFVPALIGRRTPR